MTKPDVYFAISEAARMVGVSPATLRNWEKRGVIVPDKTEHGHRRYTLDDIARLRQRHDQTGEERRGPWPNGPERNGHGAEPAGAVPDAGEIPPWANKLKYLRSTLGLSLRQVSAMTKLSPSFISAIERGHANPSVAALQRLTASFGISIVELMDEANREPKTLVRPHDRLVYDITPGVTMEQLNFGSHQMEMHLFRVAPGAGTGTTYHHIGEEFIFVLSGSLVVWIDRVERYPLTAGDVLYFASTRHHEWVNPGAETTVFLGVNTPPTF